MIPIPEAAMSVVEVLRRDVKKPKVLPELVRGRSFPLTRSCLRFKLDQEKEPRRCPMGLHPKSIGNCPDEPEAFPFGIPYSAMKAFGRDWWDQPELKDAKEAVDTVWPG